MTDTKFTPGPWVVSEEDGTVYVDTSDDHYVAMLLSGSAHDQDKADAHLIAAAPEMYEWLDAVLSTGMVEHGGMGDAIRRLLAKARGE